MNNKKTCKLISYIVVLTMFTMLFTMFTPQVMAADYGLVSTNPRIQILDNKIGVYSHINDYTYYISSDILTSSVSSSDGWTVTYTDVDKIETDCPNITDGYVKLTKGDEEVYLPITTRSDNFIDGFGVDASGKVLNPRLFNGQTYQYEVGPFGGKGYDDLSSAFTVGAAPANPAKRTSGITYTISDMSRPYTVELNVYADENVGANINFHYDDEGYELLTWKSDGSLWYNVNGTLVKSDIELQKGKWQKVAVTWDSMRHRHHIFINGTMLTDNSKYLSDAHAAILWMGMRGDSANGNVAFDDMIVYSGYYHPSPLPTVEEDSDYIKIDGDIVTYETSQFASKSELLDNLISDAVKMEVFTNRTFSQIADDKLGNGYILVLTGPDSSMSYYTLRYPVLTVEDVTFQTTDDSSIVANAKLNYSGVFPCEALMIMLISDENSRAESLYATEVKSVGSETTEFEITAPWSEGKVVEVFFINNWDDRIPCYSETYSG